MEIIQLASLDSDPWVLMVADILKSFPDTGSLNLELEEQNPNMKGALMEIIQLASLDSDPWVLMVADILKSFPDTGSLNLELEEQNPNVQDILGELREKVSLLLWTVGTGSSEPRRCAPAPSRAAPRETGLWDGHRGCTLLQGPSWPPPCGWHLCPPVRAHTPRRCLWSSGLDKSTPPHPPLVSLRSVPAGRKAEGGELSPACLAFFSRRDT
ncbi:hypothetical protein H8959_011003 [Pygathrix nigripes]